jgi:hypothetical protein
VEIDGQLGDTEPNSLSLSLFSLRHRFSLNLRLFLPILVTIQCETNGREDASVVLKRKMKKGVLEGTTMGVDEREKLRKNNNKRCFWNIVKKKKSVKGKKLLF